MTYKSDPQDVPQRSMNERRGMVVCPRCWAWTTPEEERCLYCELVRNPETDDGQPEEKER